MFHLISLWLHRRLTFVMSNWSDIYVIELYNVPHILFIIKTYHALTLYALWETFVLLLLLLFPIPDQMLWLGWKRVKSVMFYFKWQFYWRFLLIPALWPNDPEPLLNSDCLGHTPSLSNADEPTKTSSAFVLLYRPLFVCLREVNDSHCKFKAALNWSKHSVCTADFLRFANSS